MKTQSLVLTTLTLLALATPSFAGKKNKNRSETPTANPVMSKYDKNANGTLDDTEKEAVRAALATDAALKPYDKNADGKLDDTELAEVSKAPVANAEPKKRKKNKGATPAEAPKTDTPKPEAPKDAPKDAPKGEEVKKPQ